MDPKSNYGYQIPDIKLSDVGGSAVDFSKSLDAGIDNSFNEYAMLQRSQEKPLDIYGRLENEAGIPTLRKTATNLSGQVNDLEDTLRRIEPDISARSRNSLMTEAQRRATVTQEKLPIQENLGWLGQSLGRVMQGIDRATGDIGTKVGLAVQGQDRDLEPAKMRVNLMTERAARSMTGFTSDREMRFNSLLEKIKAGNQLSMFQMEEANQLAREQRAYEKEKQNMMSQTSMIDLGEQKRLINSQTGTTIASYNNVNKPAATSSWYTNLFAPNTSTNSGPKYTPPAFTPSKGR